MQKLTVELVIMFYAVAVIVYALAVIGAGIYVYWATVVNAGSGLEFVGLIFLTFPTSSFTFMALLRLLSSDALDHPATPVALIVTLVLTGLLQAAGCAVPLVAGRKNGAGK